MPNDPSEEIEADPIWSQRKNPLDFFGPNAKPFQVSKKDKEIDLWEELTRTLNAHGLPPESKKAFKKAFDDYGMRKLKEAAKMADGASPERPTNNVQWPTSKKKKGHKKK